MRTPQPPAPCSQLSATPEPQLSARTTVEQMRRTFAVHASAGSVASAGQNHRLPRSSIQASTMPAIKSAWREFMPEQAAATSTGNPCTSRVVPSRNTEKPSAPKRCSATQAAESRNHQPTGEKSSLNQGKAISGKRIRRPQPAWPEITRRRSQLQSARVQAAARRNVKFSTQPRPRSTPAAASDGPGS